MTSYHMERESTSFIRMHCGQFTHWDSFVKLLQIQFRPIGYDDLMEVLTDMKQTSSVSSYKSQFELFSNKLKGLLERHKLIC